MVMTSAMMIATFCTRVRSSGNPMSTMRSGRQARLIKIEACGGWEPPCVARRSALYLGSSSAQCVDGLPLRRADESANHVPGHAPAESDDAHLEPFPPPRPDGDLP